MLDSLNSAQLIEGLRPRGMKAPLDAVSLAARIREDLPSGCAQNYSTLVVLNHLVSYSEKYGLLLEHEDRPIVASLSAEFLYLARHHGIEIKLGQGQPEHWSLQIWKDSTTLGINLKQIVETRQPIDHEKLRDAQTLISFGAVINHYYEILQTQMNGLEFFKASYKPVTPDAQHVSPKSFPMMGFEWKWTNLWTGNNPKEPEFDPSSPAPEPFSNPGSMSPLPANLSSISTIDAMFPPRPIESISPAFPEPGSSFLPYSAPSSATIAGFDGSAVSASDRLEAYLNVLGTAEFEAVRALPTKKQLSVALEEIGMELGERRLQDPTRKALEEFKSDAVGFPQTEETSKSKRKTHTVRWMTTKELKTRRDELELQKTHERTRDLQLKNAKPSNMAKRASLVSFELGVKAEGFKSELQIIHLV